MQHTEAIREMSALSISEIAIKQARGKFVFRKEDILLGIADLQLRVLPYTATHAFHCSDGRYTMPTRLIVKALRKRWRRVFQSLLADKTFRLYKGLEVIW